MDFLSLLIGTAFSAFQANQAAKQQYAAQARQANQAAEQRWKEYERAEKERKDKLKKDLAKRRAKMGASGLSAFDGSASAIMQGLRTDQAELSYNHFSDAKEGIDQSFSNIQQNLLDTKKDIANNAAFKVANGALTSLAPIEDD